VCGKTSVYLQRIMYIVKVYRSFSAHFIYISNKTQCMVDGTTYGKNLDLYNDIRRRRFLMRLLLTINI